MAAFLVYKPVFVQLCSVLDEQAFKVYVLTINNLKSLQNSNIQCGKVIEMIHVCAAVICLNGKYLITSRPHGKHLAGKWEFPGGKIRLDESAYDCLVREIYEELSVNVIPLDLVYSTEYIYPEKNVFLEFYRAAPLDATDFNPIPNEGQGIKWKKANELLSLDWVPADLPLVLQIVN